MDITQENMQEKIYRVAEDYQPVALYYSTLLSQLVRGYEYSIASLAQDISDILLDEERDEEVEGEEKELEDSKQEKEKTQEESEPSTASQLASIFSTREFTDIPASHHVEALVSSSLTNSSTGSFKPS
jgi:hypothetical protein